MRHHSCGWLCVRGPIERLLCSCYDRKLSYDAVPPPWGAKAVPAVRGPGTLPVQLTFRQTTRRLLGAHVLG